MYTYTLSAKRSSWRLKESKAKGGKKNRIFGTDLLGLSMCSTFWIKLPPLSIMIVDQKVLLSNPKEMNDLKSSNPSIWPPTIFGPKNP